MDSELRTQNKGVLIDQKIEHHLLKMSTAEEKIRKARTHVALIKEQAEEADREEQMAATSLDAIERVVKAAGYAMMPAGRYADSAIRTGSLCVALAEAIIPPDDEGPATIRQVEVVGDSVGEANIALRACHTVHLTRELEKAAIAVYESARSAFLLTQQRRKRLEKDQILAIDAEYSLEKINGDHFHEFIYLLVANGQEARDRRAKNNTEEDKVEVLEVDKEDHQEEEEDTE
jgi:hypothetical protein